MKRWVLPAVLVLLLCACSAGRTDVAGPDIPGAGLPEQPGAQQPADGGDEAPPAEVPPVYADWSRLPADGLEMEELAEQYWGAPQQELIPDDGYGLLIPYLGEEMTVGLEYEETGWEWCRYGLATADGAVAVEPVYDSVYLLTCRHAGYHNETLPVYVVRTTMEDGERRSGLVAADGSWCTGLTYQAAYGISTEQILLVDENYLAWICDLDGRVTPSPMQEPLNKLWGDWWMELTSINSTVACMDAPGGGSWFVNFLTGQTRFLPGVSGCWQWTADGGLAVAYEDEKSGYLDCSGDWAIAPQFAYAGEFFGGYAVVNRTSSSPDEVINAQGETVLVSRGRVNQCEIGGLAYYVELDGDGRILAIRDSKLQPVAVPAEGAELLSSYGGLVWRQPDGTAHFWNGRQTGALPDADFNIDSWHNGMPVLYRFPEERNVTQFGIWDPVSGEWLLGPLEENYLYLIDQVTGQSYLHTYASGDIYDCGGRRLFSCKKAENPFNGIFPVRSGIWTGLMDQDGNWILRLRLRTPAD